MSPLALRSALEAFVEAAIDLLDAMDADEFDRETVPDGEPDTDDEIISEDDGVVIGLRQVGRQA